MEYKQIPGYPNYGITKLGEVKNFETGRTFRGHLHKKTGYYQTTLKRKSYGIHVLLAMTYLGHVPCGYEIVVDHKNTLRFDNRLENLQLITNRENVNKDKKDRISKYPGVTLCRGRWVSRIWINGKRKNLGSFSLEIQAHEAYERAKANLSKTV